MTESCVFCNRPLWDGGHALNEAECDNPGDETCRLYARVQLLEAQVKDESSERFRLMRKLSEIHNYAKLNLRNMSKLAVNPSMNEVAYQVMKLSEPK
jgi:hypothetical protein